MKKYSAVIILLFVALTGCRKATKFDPNFVGEWRANTGVCNISISIPSEGKSRYYKVCDTIYVETKGVAYLKSKKQVLKIGKREFDIYGGSADSYVPYEIYDTMRITLDGIYYTKID